ncbi:MAG TPA: LacI family DNA-binding transcriptional regulator [Terracidiphilus sp.]|nr:LacI family DNA-binding transcriptional regulator [Terracidiphilus sp.]
MRVRLQDIADDLNLSKMTISKVLRGQADISDATKARVLKRVKELNYIPNISASSLRTGQTRTLGLILPSIGKPFFGEVAAGITHAVGAAGYGLIVSSSQEDADAEQRQIEVFLSLQVDALLIVTLQETSAFFNQVGRLKETPVIFLNGRPAGAKGSYAGINEEEVGRIACEHLIQCGCKRIAYIRGSHSAAGDMRYKGYLEALARHRLTAHADLVAESMNADESEFVRGYTAMERLLARRGRPDGVMTYTDMLAAGAMEAAGGARVRVPEDIRFVGCGNDAAICGMRIPLTSMDVGGRELGQRAGKLALRVIHEGGRSTYRALVKPRLVRRRSSEGSRPGRAMERE